MVNVFSGEHLANGLLSRFLLAQPPEPRRQWCSSRTASDITDTVADRFATLSKLDLPEGDDLPRALGLSAEAEGLYAAWFNALNERRRDTEPGPFRSALAKAEEIPGRLGLILALGRSDRPATVEDVDGDTMQRAIALADWFANEIERVLGTFSETPEAREARKLVEWIRERGEATARDVARGIRKYSGRGGSERAETDLRALVSAGDLVAEDHPGGPAGGRPTVIYKPTSLSTSSKPVFFSENNGVLSTSTGSTPLESPPEPEPDPPATPGPEPDPVDLFDADEPTTVPGNGKPNAEPFALHSAVVMALLVDGPQRPEGLADRPEIRAHDATGRGAAPAARGAGRGRVGPAPGRWRVGSAPVFGVQAGHGRRAGPWSRVVCALWPQDRPGGGIMTGRGVARGPPGGGGSADHGQVEYFQRISGAGQGATTTTTERQRKMTRTKTDKKPDVRSLIVTELVSKGPGGAEEIFCHLHDVLGFEIVTQDDVDNALQDLEQAGWIEPMFDSEIGELGWVATRCPACRLLLMEDRPETGRFCLICGLPTTTTEGNAK